MANKVTEKQPPTGDNAPTVAKLRKKTNQLYHNAPTSATLSDFQRIRKLEYEYCKTHLVYFVKKYVYFEDRDSAEVIVKFKPWDAQLDALRMIRDNKLNLFLKARQIGITWVGLSYCLWDIFFHPGHSDIALSKTQTDAEELVRRMGVMLSKLGALIFGGDITITQKSQEIIIDFGDGQPRSTFRAFPASPSAGRSFTANVVMIDEWAFQMFADEIWTAAYPTINRPTGGKVIGISTIKRGTLFERLWCGKNNWAKMFISVFADPRRNKKWYEETKDALGELIKQEYPRTADEALANIGGSFFNEFDPSVHVIDPIEIPSDWRIYSAMDYGLDMLAHYKVAVDSARNVYVFHEIHKSGLVVSEAADLIKKADLCDGNAWHIPEVRLAPPDLFARELTSGKSQAIGFADYGVDLVKSSNDRETGWLYIKELLRGAKANDGRPGLYIFRTCTNLITSLTQLLIDEKKPNDCAREPHDITHAADGLRYFAIWWYTPPTVKKEKRKKVVWNDSMYEDYYNANERDQKMLLEKWGDPFDY